MLRAGESHRDAHSPEGTRNPDPRKILILLLIWVALFLAAASLDRATANAVRNHGPLDRSALWVRAIKSPGDFRFTLSVAMLLLLFHHQRFKAAAAVLLSGILGGLLYSVLKWVAGRERPGLHNSPIEPWTWHPFPDGLHGMFAKGGLSFPSGHACLSFATAMTLALALPRYRWLWFFLASLVAAERVLENAHYLTDVVAGAGVGIICGCITWNALGRVIPSAEPRGFPLD